MHAALDAPPEAARTRPAAASPGLGQRRRDEAQVRRRRIPVRIRPANREPGQAGQGARRAGAGRRTRHARPGGQRREQEDQAPRRHRPDAQTRTTPRRPGAVAGGRRLPDLSPDGKSFVFARNHNLFLAEAGKEDAAVALSTDGVEDYSLRHRRLRPGRRQAGEWQRERQCNASRDASPVRPQPQGPRRGHLVARLEGVLRDPVRLPRGQGPLRHQLAGRPPGRRSRSTSIRCPARRRSARPSCTSTTSRPRRSPACRPKWKDESYTNVHWGKTAADLRFVRRDRLVRHLEFCTLDVLTGAVEVPDHRGVRERHPRLPAGPLPRRDRRDDLVVRADRLGPLLPLRPRRQAQERDHLGPLPGGQHRRVDAKNRLLYFTGQRPRAGREHLPTSTSTG